MNLKLNVLSIIKKSYTWIFLAAIFMMVAGDFPRFPLGIKERHLFLLLISWPKLYVVLLCTSFLIYIWNYKIDIKQLSTVKFLFYPVIIVSAAFFLSILFSADKIMSISAFSYYVAIIVLSFMILFFLEKDDVLAALWKVLTFAICFLAVRVILWRLDEGFHIGAYHVKNNSWLGKLQIAWVLNFFAPFLLGRFLVEKGIVKRIICGITWVLSGIAIWILFSRTGSVVFILTTFLFSILNLRHWRLLILFIVAFTILLFLVVGKSRYMSSYVFSSTAKFYNEYGMMVRKGIWKETIKMFLDHPVTGIGLGTYDEIAYSRYHTQFDFTGSDRNWFYRNGWHAHNVLLHLLAEVGLVGTLAYLYLWYKILSELIKRWVRSTDITVKITASSLFCFIIAFFVLSVTENPIAVRVYESFRMNLTICFLVLFGIYAVSYYEKRSKEREVDL